MFRLVATTQALAAADPDHYVWWFPGSPAKIHLSLQVAQRLQHEIRDSQAAGPSEGLLFGKSQNGVTEILRFQPVAKATVQSVISALPADKKRSLVGYYRTGEGDFRLTPEDRSLEAACFAERHHVFLLIHTAGFAPPTATFLFHGEDGQMVDFAFLEFPFDASLLAVEERDRMRRSEQAATENAVAVTSPARLTAPGTRPRKRSRVRLVVWGCAIALGFGCGVAVSNDRIRERLSQIWQAAVRRSSLTPPPSPSVQPKSYFALHVLRQNGDLELTWNPESAPIAAATSGLITIQDGGSRRLVPLDTAQLRGGNLLYSPASDQILMQMTVTSPSETVSESVTAVLPKAAPPVIPRAPAVVPPPVVESALPPKAARPFTAPGSALIDRPRLQPLPQDAPIPKSSAAPEVSLPAVVLKAPDPQQPTPAQPAQPALKVVSYEPAVAMVKPMPIFPIELRNLSVRQTVVQVKVSIDKRGKVTKAEAVPQTNVSRFLLNAAANAAQLWRFQPARQGGEPVSSESVVQFVFSH